MDNHFAVATDVTDHLYLRAGSHVRISVLPGL